MSNSATFQLDLIAPRPLTQQERAELRALAEMPSIDIGSLDSFMDSAAQNRAASHGFFKARKTSTTVKLDADIVSWLYSLGKDHQDKLNAILREAMTREIRHKGFFG